MTKGEKTRLRIIKNAGTIMNQQGYSSTSISEVMAVSGIKKGGLYNHFDSKNSLLLEAFENNAAFLGSFFKGIIQSHPDPKEQIFALIDASVEIATGRIVAGGCPVLNAGTEADDSNEELRVRVEKTAFSLLNYFRSPLTSLSLNKRLSTELSIEDLSLMIVATVEGGIFWSKLTKDSLCQIQILQCLKAFLATVISN